MISEIVLDGKLLFPFPRHAAAPRRLLLQFRGLVCKLLVVATLRLGGVGADVRNFIVQRDLSLQPASVVVGDWTVKLRPGFSKFGNGTPGLSVDSLVSVHAAVGATFVQLRKMIGKIPLRLFCVDILALVDVSSVPVRLGRIDVTVVLLLLVDLAESVLTLVVHPRHPRLLRRRQPQ